MIRLKFKFNYGYLCVLSGPEASKVSRNIISRKTNGKLCLYEIFNRLFLNYVMDFWKNQNQSWLVNSCQLCQKKYLVLLISTVNIRKPPCLEIFSKLMKRRPLWSGFTSIAQVFKTVKCRESKAGPARCSFCHQKHLIWGKRYHELLFQTRFLYEFSPLCLLLCLRTHLSIHLKMSLSSLNCGF